MLEIPLHLSQESDCVYFLPSCCFIVVILAESCLLPAHCLRTRLRSSSLFCWNASSAASSRVLFKVRGQKLRAWYVLYIHIHKKYIPTQKGVCTCVLGNAQPGIVYILCDISQTSIESHGISE